MAEFISNSAILPPAGLSAALTSSSSPDPGGDHFLDLLPYTD